MLHTHDCAVPRVRSPADASVFLQSAGLRPTRQRQALALSLFGSGEGRHVTAEELHVEARAAGHRVSLATIYNTLHSFASAGLVREIAIGGAKRYFDTNTSNHNHFHIARDGMLMDIDAAAVRVDACRPRRPACASPMSMWSCTWSRLSSRRAVSRPSWYAARNLRYPAVSREDGACG